MGCSPRQPRRIIPIRSGYRTCLSTFPLFSVGVWFAYVNLQLIKSRSPTGRNLLHRLWWGLKETGAKLANGRKVFNRNDAVVWLIEKLEERA